MIKVHGVLLAVGLVMGVVRMWPIMVLPWDLVGQLVSGVPGMLRPPACMLTGLK